MDVCQDGSEFLFSKEELMGFGFFGTNYETEFRRMPLDAIDNCKSGNGPNSQWHKSMNV